MLIVQKLIQKYRKANNFVNHCWRIVTKLYALTQRILKAMEAIMMLDDGLHVATLEDNGTD